MTDGGERAIVRENLGLGVSVERAHLLDDVIENIERNSEHYAKRSITLRMGENDELWRRFKELDDKAGAEAADDDAR